MFNLQLWRSPYLYTVCDWLDVRWNWSMSWHRQIPGNHLPVCTR